MTDIAIHRAEHRLRRPFGSASRRWTGRETLIVTLRDGRFTGEGEAAPLDGHSRESIDEAADILHKHSALIEKLATTEASGDLALKLTKAMKDCPSAIFAAETAIYNLWARKFGCHATDIWGDPARDRVPVNAVIDLDSAEDSLRELLLKGIRSFKVKLETDPRKNAGRLRRVRELLPPGTSLRGDANGSWSFADAEENLKALEFASLDYVEQPLAPGQEKYLKELRKISPVPLAVDESIKDADGLRKLVSSKAADVYVLKPTVLGGWRATRNAVQLIRDSGASWVLSSALESAVGRRACFELACTMEDPFLPAGLLTAGWFSDDDGLQLKDGCISRAKEPDVSAILQ